MTIDQQYEHARALCLALGRPGLAALLDPEPEDRAARALVLGPVSAGKSATITSLIGAPAAVGGQPILPIGVQPLTAQLTLIECGQPALSLHAAHDDGTVRVETDPAAIREVLVDVARPYRMSRLALVGPAQLPGWSFLDAPGLGRANEDPAVGDLVAHGVAMADLVLLHVDALRGLGRAQPALSILEAVAPDRAALVARLLPVITNVRSAGRAEEIEEQLAERFPGMAPAVRVPRQGDVAALGARLDQWRAGGGVARSDALRRALVLRSVVVPALGRLIAAAADPALADEIRILEASVGRARDAERTITALAAQAQARLGARLAALADAAEVEARAEVDRYADAASPFALDAARREVGRTVENTLAARFAADVESAIVGELEALQHAAEDLLHSFDVEVVAPVIERRAPAFERTVQQAARQGGHFGVQIAIGALGQRLGGKSGSVILATQNLARSAAARSWRALTGRALAQDTVRSTIPRLVRPVGALLKFVKNNQVAVAVAVELAFLGWNAWWARDKVRAAGHHLIDQWRDGVAPSARAHAQAAIGGDAVAATKPVRALLRDQVRQIWAGDGVDAQVARWRALVRGAAQGWEEELVGLRTVRADHRALEQRWAALSAAVTADR